MGESRLDVESETRKSEIGNVQISPLKIMPELSHRGLDKGSRL